MELQSETHLQRARDNREDSTGQCLSNESTDNGNVNETRDPEMELPKVPAKKVFICEFCGINKATLRELSLHLLLHVGAMPYYCLKCRFSSISLTHLYSHLMQHIEFSEDDLNKRRRLKSVMAKMVHICNVCSYPFKFYHDLISHYLVHIRSSYKCAMCSFVFISESDCLIHSHLHNSLACRVCSQKFSEANYSDYLLHVLTHDHTKMYRKFPRIPVDHKTVPYYKSFFDICFKISSFTSTTHWSIGNSQCASRETGNVASNENLSQPIDQFQVNLTQICEAVLEEECASSYKYDDSHTDFNDCANLVTFKPCSTQIERQQKLSNRENHDALSVDKVHQSVITAKGMFKSTLSDCEVRRQDHSFSLKSTSARENPLVHSEVVAGKCDTLSEVSVEEDVIECIDVGCEDAECEDMDITHCDLIEEPLNLISPSTQHQTSSTVSSQEKMSISHPCVSNLNDKISNQKKKYKPVNAVFPLNLSSGKEIISLIEKRDSLTMEVPSASEEHSTSPADDEESDYRKLKRRLIEPQFVSTVTSMWEYGAASLSHSNHWNTNEKGVLHERQSPMQLPTKANKLPLNKQGRCSPTTSCGIQTDRNSPKTITKKLLKRICALREHQDLWSEDGVQANKISSGVSTHQNDIDCLSNTTPVEEESKKQSPSTGTSTYSQSRVQDTDKTPALNTDDQAYRSAVEHCFKSGKRLTVALRRLPDEIFSVLRSAEKEVAERVEKQPAKLKSKFIGATKRPKKMRAVKPFNATVKRMSKNKVSMSLPDNSFSMESYVSDAAQGEIGNDSFNQQSAIAPSRGIISSNDVINENMELDNNQINVLSPSSANASSQVGKNSNLTCEDESFNMDGDDCGLSELKASKRCRVFDDVDFDELVKSHGFKKTNTEIESVRSRIKRVHDLLETAKRPHKQLFCKELRVVLFQLPDYILEKHRKKKPIMMSNLLPVIDNVQSLAD